MAGNIKGITVEIGGDTTGLQKALTKVNKEINATQRELKSVDKALKLDPKNTELLAQKQKLLSDAIEQTRGKVESLKRAKEEADKAITNGEKVNEEEYRRLQREISNAESSLKSLTQQSEEFAKQNSKLEKVGETVGKVGDKMKVVSATSAALLGATVLAFNELDKGYDIIVERTGATGEALKDIQKTMEDVYGSLPVDVEDAGNAVGEVSTRFKVQGEELKTLSEEFLQFSKITHTDVANAVGQTQKIMAVWNIEAGKTNELLGMITAESQRTGASVDALMSAVLDNSATFKELDLNLAESINLVSEFEANGINSAAALAALKKSAAAYTKEGKSLKEGLAETINEIKNAATETEALAAAQKVFGAKGALEMAKAIREGRLSVDGLTKSMSKYGNVVQTTFENTLDPADQAKVAFNNLKVAGAQLGATMMNALSPILEKLVKTVQKIVDAFSKMTDGQKKLVLTVLAITAAIGPLLTGIASLITAFGVLKGAVIALTAAMDTNPIFLLITAIALLVTGIAALATAAGKNSAATQEMTARTQEYVDGAAEMREKVDAVTKSVEGLNKSAQESIVSAEAEAKAHGYLADELYTLSEKTTLTADEKNRMRQIVDDLNGSIYGLNLQLDDETGKLNMTRDALQQVIDKTLEQAKAQVTAKLYVEQIENMYRAQLNAAEATKKMSAAQAELSKLEAENAADNSGPLSEERVAREQAILRLKDAIQGYKQELEDSKNAAQAAYDSGETMAKTFGGEVPDAFKAAKKEADDFFKKLKGSKAGEYVTNFAKDVEEAAPKATAEANKLSTDAVKAAEEGGKGIGEKGKNFAQGYEQGIRSGKEKAYRAGFDLGREAVRGTADAQKSKSPAKETINLGKFFTEGFDIGIESGFETVNRTAANLATNALDALKESIKDNRSEVQKVMDSWNKVELEEEKKYRKEKERQEEWQEKERERLSEISDSKERTRQQKIFDKQVKADKKYLEELKETADKARAIYDATLKDAEKATSDSQNEIIKSLEDIASAFEKTISSIKSARNSLADTLNSNKLYTTKNVKVEGQSYTLSSLADVGADVASLANYNKMLDELFSKRKLPPEVKQALQKMGVTEGTEFVSALLNASDAEYATYVENIAKRAQMSEGIATKLYADELESVADEVQKEFSGVVAGFDALGSEAARLFGEGFVNNVKRISELLKTSFGYDISKDFENPFSRTNVTNNVTITQNIQSDAHTAYDTAQATNKAVGEALDKVVIGI